MQPPPASSSCLRDLPKPGAANEALSSEATKLKTVGVHHYGLACDLVKDIAGEPSWKGDFAFLGRLAKKHKMIWGGDWRSPGARHEFVDSVACPALRCTAAEGAVRRNMVY